MKRLIVIAALLGVGGVAAAQRTPAVEPGLVQEFKGLAPARARAPEALQADYEKAAKYLLARMSDRNLSSRRRVEARADLERICLRAGRPGAGAERTVLCGVLAGLLGDAGASRGVLLKMLEYIGSGESADAVSKLLADDDPQTRERARRALEANPSPQAAEKLRRALFQALKPEEKIALINSLGQRQDAPSVDGLGRLLKDKDQDVALAAAAALGKIAGPAATQVLNDARLLAMHRLRDAVADALFACAERARASGDEQTALTIYRKTYENPLEPRLSRIAALRRVVAWKPARALPVLTAMLAGTDTSIVPTALELAREAPGRGATEAFAALLPRAKTPERVVALIDLLGARGDPAGREAVLAAMRGRQWPRDQRERVRLAVVRALGGVGTEADVPLLAGLAAQAIKGKELERASARRSLQQLRGEKVNATILASLGEGDTALRAELIRALGAREVTAAAPKLLEMSGETDALVRSAALGALGQLADDTALPALGKWLAETKEGREVYVAERAILSTCLRSRRKDAAAGAVIAAMKGASVRARCALMRICGRLGGTQAIAALARGVRDPDRNVQQEALRALTNSTDVRAGEELLKVAGTAAKPEDKLRALNGYIRLIRYANQPPEKKLWMFIQALDLATRPEEKKLALAGLGDIKVLAAMALAMEHLDDAEVRPTAEVVVYRVARHVYEKHPTRVRQAMERLLRLTASQETVKEARRILDLAKAAEKKATKKP